MGTEHDLASTLFGKTRRAVLALTYGHADESFHLRRIARFAASGMGVVQRELRQLVDAGILTRTVSGHQTYYQADRACPIFDELRSVVTKTAGVADILRDALAPLGERLAIAFIFGSVARGSEGAASDVDLLIVGDVTFGEVAEAVGPAQERLAREVNPKVYPQAEFVTKVRAGQHFLTRVLALPKVFLVGTDHDLARLVA